MGGRYLSRKEAARFLGRSEATVRRLVESGKLPVLIWGRQRWIPEEALEQWKRFGNVQMPRLGTADSLRMLRRDFNRALVRHVGTFVATVAGGIATAEVIVRRQFQEAERKLREARLKDEIEARALFTKIFGDRLGSRRSGSTGRDYFQKGRHPDNRAAADVVFPLVGLAHPTAIVAPQGVELEIDPRGDVVLVGGPNSTPWTMLAWEFEGPDDRHLTRPKDAILPLRFYGISDVDDPSMKRDQRIGWKMENVGPVTTVNWYIVDTKHPRRTRRPMPFPNRQVVTSKGDKGHIPRDNYLLITSLPNFLSPDIRDFRRLNPAAWPRILVIEGNHGLGTRAVELLLTSDGLRQLQETKTALKGATEFQVLFHVRSIDETRGGFHRFTEIELDDVERMDHIGIDIYQKANRAALKRMAALGLKLE